MSKEQQNERIDNRVLQALRFEDRLSRVAIAKKTGLNIEDVKLSVQRLKKQGYVGVRGSACFLTEFAENVCF